MKSLSPRAKRALAQYRSTHVLPVDARERALRGLRARIAAGDPGLGAAHDVYAPPVPSPRAARLLRFGVVGGIGGLALLGGLLLGTSWLRPPPESVAVAPAAVALAGSTHLPEAPISSDSNPATPAAAPERHQSERTRREASLPAVRREREVARRAIPSATQPASRPELQPAAAAPARDDADSIMSAARAASPTEASVESRDASSPRVSLPSARPPEPDDSLDAEVALLRSAHEQLRLGQPLRALSALTEHAGRFPRGELLEMRKVTRIMALCALEKREAARDEAQRFLEQHASSSYGARVRQLCAPEGAKQRLR